MIPEEIIGMLEEQLRGLRFGSCILRITVHDGHLRFAIVQEKSVVPNRLTSGSSPEAKHEHG